MSPTEAIVVLHQQLKELAQEVIEDEAISGNSPEGQWARTVLAAAQEYEHATQRFINQASLPMPKRRGRPPA